MVNCDLGVYIHIPFCKTKCLYCDFPSYAEKESYMKAYLEAILEEIALARAHLESHKIRSIYIGGGTPTYFKISYIAKILDALYKFSDIDDDIEISIEANPDTLDKDKLRSLKNYGINRLSLGVQAFQKKHLKALGRTHDFKDVISKILLAQSIGYENISVDLMFGLPNQTLDEWIETLQNICKLDVQHISAYSLKIEEGTALYNQLQRGEIEPIDDIKERQMYRKGGALLEKNGYIQYEISNFAKKGFRSLHNLRYWKNNSYIGFGCGAHSYIGGKRRYNHLMIDEYIDAICRGKTAIAHEEAPTPAEERFETIMMGLRLTRGIDKYEFRQRFGRPIDFYYKDVIDQLKDEGLLGENPDSIYVTAKGMDIHNLVLLHFLDYI